MSSAAYLLVLGDADWRVARIDGDDVELQVIPAEQPRDPEAVRQVVRALRELGHNGQEVCLALPSSMVLAEEIDVEGLPRKQRRSLMLYRLEEMLPLDAERLTADFLPQLAGRSLGLAVETGPVGQVLEQLSQASVEVSAICPLAMLVAWQVCRGQTELPEYLILADGQEVDILRISGRQPVAWYSTGTDAEELVRCIDAAHLAGPASADRPAATVLGDLPADGLTALANRGDLQVTLREEGDPMALAARTAGGILAGGKGGWVDFRRDELAPTDPWGRVRGLLRMAAVSAILLLVAVTGTLYLRGMQYDAITRDYQAQQTAEFARLNPNIRVPRHVKSRLRSDLTRLTAVSGPGSRMPDRPCSLDSLRRVIAAMPTSIRMRIVEVRIDHNGIVIEGHSRQHNGAEKFARALRQAGFDVQAPRTQSLVRGGVSFMIVGKHGQATQLAKAAGGDR